MCALRVTRTHKRGRDHVGVVGTRSRGSNEGDVTQQYKIGHVLEQQDVESLDLLGHVTASARSRGGSRR
eukprot:2360176-Rhodomonas_salina.1